MAVMFRAGAVVAYAAAMGYAEAAAVAYLRQALVGSSAGQLQSSLMRIESGREAATIVMLATVGGIAGRTWLARFSYLTIAFGVGTSPTTGSFTYSWAGPQAWPRGMNSSFFRCPGSGRFGRPPW